MPGVSTATTGRPSGLAVRSGAQAAEVAAGLPSGGSALGVALDVTDPASVQGVWDAAIEQFGRVDVWINNAGVAHTTQHIVDIPPDDVAASAKIPYTVTSTRPTVPNWGMPRRRNPGIKVRRRTATTTAGAESVPCGGSAPSSSSSCS